MRIVSKDDLFCEPTAQMIGAVSFPRFVIFTKCKRSVRGKGKSYRCNVIILKGQNKHLEEKV